MSRIDAHAVTGHGVLDFVNDSPSRGFNSKDFGHFNDMIGSGMFPDDT
jgi:hypothetical protein